MKGINKRTVNITNAFIEAAGNECEDCDCPNNLEIHRITPGYKGGTYAPRNCKVLCKSCHKRYSEDW